MAEVITFHVPGQPIGKGRPRVSARGGFARMYTPEKTADYEALVAHQAQRSMAGKPLYGTAVGVNLFMDCAVPASWSGKKQREALQGLILPGVKPDADNVIKAIFDGMNGVVWRDDALVTDLRVRKRYGATPGVRVEVWSMEQPVPQESLLDSVSDLQLVPGFRTLTTY